MPDLLRSLAAAITATTEKPGRVDTATRMAMDGDFRARSERIDLYRERECRTQARFSTPSSGPKPAPSEPDGQDAAYDPDHIQGSGFLPVREWSRQNAP